jgi:hypothetical protein
MPGEQKEKTFIFAHNKSAREPRLWVKKTFSLSLSFLLSLSLSLSLPLAHQFTINVVANASVHFLRNGGGALTVFANRFCRSIDPNV